MRRNDKVLRSQLRWISRSVTYKYFSRQKFVYSERSDDIHREIILNKHVSKALTGGNLQMKNNNNHLLHKICQTKLNAMLCAYKGKRRWNKTDFYENLRIVL